MFLIPRILYERIVPRPTASTDIPLLARPHSHFNFRLRHDAPHRKTAHKSTFSIFSYRSMTFLLKIESCFSLFVWDEWFDLFYFNTGRELLWTLSYSICICCCAFLIALGQMFIEDVFLCLPRPSSLFFGLLNLRNFSFLLSLPAWPDLMNWSYSLVLGSSSLRGVCSNSITSDVRSNMKVVCGIFFFLWTLEGIDFCALSLVWNLSMSFLLKPW